MTDFEQRMEKKHFDLVANLDRWSFSLINAINQQGQGQPVSYVSTVMGQGPAYNQNRMGNSSGIYTPGAFPQPGPTQRIYTPSNPPQQQQPQIVED